MRSKSPSRIMLSGLSLITALSCWQQTALARRETFILPLEPRIVIKSHEATAPCVVPPPVLTLALESKYGKDGPERDDVDPEAEAAFNAGLKPVLEFQRPIVTMANRFTEKGNQNDAACVITWLAAWAKADALSQMGNHTAEYKRSTTLAGLAMAYMQVRRAMQDSSDIPIIDRWLAMTATRIRDHFDGLKPTRRSFANNHRYWAAFAVGATAAITGDKPLFDWAMDSLKRAACAATPEGALPLELARGKKAREYHFHALNALVPLAELAEANGVSAYTLCNKGLQRIVAYAVDAIDNPATMAKDAHAEQEAFDDKSLLPPTSRLPFLEIYLKRFPGQLTLPKNIMKDAPFRLSDLGGRVHLLFRAKLR